MYSIESKCREHPQIVDAVLNENAKGPSNMDHMQTELKEHKEEALEEAMTTLKS